MELIIFLLIWLGVTAIGSLLRAAGVLLRTAWQRRGRAGRWTLRELGDPFACYGCVAVGVLGTTTFPASLMSLLGMPGLTLAALTPLAALFLAGRVFDTRAYARWRARRNAPLAARMIAAVSDGLTWPRWWR